MVRIDLPRRVRIVEPTAVRYANHVSECRGLQPKCQYSFGQVEEVVFFGVSFVCRRDGGARRSWTARSAASAR